MERKPISALTFISIAGMALAGLCCEYGLGWIMFFSPGWTNDPVFGPNFHSVLATAMTGWGSLLLMTAAVGPGAVVGFLCALLGVGKGQGRRLYGGWLLFAAVVILFVSIWIFRSFHAQVRQEFPNGYHVTSQATGGEVSFREL